MPDAIYSTFSNWVEAVVLPLRASNPGFRRLDGNDSGGNRTSAGRFRHNGRVWNVHADTHFETVLLAYEDARHGDDPFVEVLTASGTSLDLRPELQKRRVDRRFKYLYVYASS